MPLISLIAGLVLAAQTASQDGTSVPMVAISDIRPAAARAPDDSEWQELLALDRTYRWHKRATIITGVVGGGAAGLGAAMVLLDVMGRFLFIFGGHGNTSSGNPDHFLETGVFLVEAGVVLEAAAGVGAIVTTYHGIQLRKYERKTGYRVSVVPVVQPRAGGYGALARVEF